MSQSAPFDLLGELPQGTVVLEASAGTGKTFTIAALVARYLAEGLATIEQLMIITFSRAATQELRFRIRQRLVESEQVLSGAATVDPVLSLLCEKDQQLRYLKRKRISQALTDFDKATIATTHEFCHRMVASLGTLADQEPRAAFMPDLQGFIRAVVWDEFLLSFSDQKRPVISAAECFTMSKAALLNPAIRLGPPQATGVAAQRIEFANQVRHKVQQRKLERGVFSYDDMLLRLLAALDHPQLGPQAAARLSARYPIVLIDEFQDTDPVQWQIVDKAFVSRSTVILIGDPKQAIYAFRGADVSSYLSALTKADQQATLAKNYRSDARLVTALDKFLGGLELGDPRIVVTAVSPVQHEIRLDAVAPWHVPIRLKIVPPQDEGSLSASKARELINRDLAADIVGLLSSSAIITSGSARRTIKPSDIAVLVRTNAGGRRALQALRNAGIPAVFSATGSVFSTQAAHDWLVLLRALHHNRSNDVRKTAISCFVGWQLSDLVKPDVKQLNKLATQIRSWADLLDKQGVAAVFEAIRFDTELEKRILSHVDGERNLTDIRHIGQELQAYHRSSRCSISQLIDWLQSKMKQSRTGGIDERSRRLETDAQAVQIFTIHASKGLEFPVVYLPEAADQWIQDKDQGQVFSYHLHTDNGAEPILDVGGRFASERNKRFDQYRSEDAAEELRKFYVALTRAKSLITMWWAPMAYNTPASALHRIIFADRDKECTPKLSYPLQSPREATWLQSVLTLETVEFDPSITFTQHVDRYELNARRFTRGIDHYWRRTSYSGLTAVVHDSYVAGLPITSDEPEPSEFEVNNYGGEVLDPHPSPMADLPSGADFGTVVHGIFEELDFTVPDLAKTLPSIADRWLAKYPLAEVRSEKLATAIIPAIQTPLGKLANHHRLADIGWRDRYAELSFDLPLNATGVSPVLSDIARLWRDHVQPSDPLYGYADDLAATPLCEQVLRGYLTGSIDALLRVFDEQNNPKYLVVDYKTNRIAPPDCAITIEHFSPQAMISEMKRAHYPLQALLYCVATHRFLRWRQPHYCPDTHLGGALYLFLRGMAGPSSTGHGVFSWRPATELVCAVSDLLAQGVEP